MTAAALGTRGRRVAPRAAVGLGCLIALIIVATVPLASLARQDPLTAAGTGLLLGVPFAGVGVIVARRQPRNPIGWLSLAFAAGFLLSIDAGFYLVAAYRLGHHLPLAPVMLFGQPLWAPALALLPLMILLFPDGRLPSPRWRWAVAAYAALCALFPLVGAIRAAGAIGGHRIRVDTGGDLIASHAASPAGWFSGLGFALIVLFSLSFVGRQAVSWRRSSADRRQQLKWLVAGGAVSVASVALGAAVGNAPGIGQLVSNILGFGLVAIPVCIGVAILRYRLYDIDRIISRTLAYVLVTGLLVGVYAGLVLLATRVLPFSGSVAVAGSTLVAAALFNPLRRRVQRVVDRRFNRSRYDADQMVAAFSARLQDVTDLDGVRTDLLGTVQQALEPAHTSLWIGGGQS
ncbi:MAG TPA: hypothetical protein VIX86_22760 [Streptosporangiaceae bacterium]